jgi:hypothetical protein
MKLLPPFFFLWLITYTQAVVVAQDEYEEESNWSGQGEVAIETRQFQKDDDENTEDTGLAAFARVSTTYEGDALKIEGRGFIRVDQKDSDRDVIILEDAYAQWSFGQNKAWTLTGGYKIFNWTSMEAFTPVDVINSRNLDSDLEKMEKKGELTFSAAWAIFNGDLSVYFWPRYEDPEYPGDKSRLGVGADLQGATWVDESSSDQFGLQWGARLSQTIEDFDFALHVIQHMDRDHPIVGSAGYTVVSQGLLLPNTVEMNIPYYFRVTQAGGTFQYVYDSFVIKLEGAHRDFEEDLNILTAKGGYASAFVPPVGWVTGLSSAGLRKPADHQVVAGGFEYAYTHEGGGESTFYLEGQSVMGTDSETAAELNAFQNDIFAAWRYAFNDVKGKEFMLSFIMDVEREHEFFYSAKYQQRISNNWKFKVGARVYDAPQKGSTTPEGLEILNKDNQIYLNVIRYF